MIQTALAFNDCQTEAHDAFAQAVERFPLQLVHDYLQQHRHVVSTDLAAHFAPNYPTAILGVARLPTALAEPAHTLAAHVWQTVVTEAANSASDEPAALIVAGPKGSGKTAMMQTLKREITERIQAILFTSLSDVLYVYKRIEEAIAASERMQVVVAYLHRPVELCSRTALLQAIETGDTIPLDLLAE